MPVIVPGIGYAGLGQQTSANQLVFSKGMGRVGGQRSVRARRRRAPKKRAAVRASGRRRRRSSRTAKFVKGSAAAKRHMAKLRKMRKR